MDLAPKGADVATPVTLGIGGSFGRPWSAGRRKSPEISARDRNSRVCCEWRFLLCTAVLWKRRSQRCRAVRVRLAVQLSKSLPSGVEEKEIEQLPVYSATSFATYLQSDFCIWMDRLAAECPDHPLCAKMGDPRGLQYFWKLGLDVEEALIEWIRCQHPEWTFLDLHLSAEDAWKCGDCDWRSAAAQQTLKALDAEVRI